MPPLESLVARVRGEYTEMPGLGLTLAQACRLWQIDAPTCAAVLNHLTCEHFLYKTSNDVYILRSTTDRLQERAGSRNPAPFRRSA